MCTPDPTRTLSSSEYLLIGPVPTLSLSLSHGGLTIWQGFCAVLFAHPNCGWSRALIQAEVKISPHWWNFLLILTKAPIWLECHMDMLIKWQFVKPSVTVLLALSSMTLLKSHPHYGLMWRWEWHNTTETLSSMENPLNNNLSLTQSGVVTYPTPAFLHALIKSPPFSSHPSIFFVLTLLFSRLSIPLIHLFSCNFELNSRTFLQTHVLWVKPSFTPG